MKNLNQEISGIISNIVKKYPYKSSKLLFTSELEYLADRVSLKTTRDILALLDKLELEDHDDSVDDWKHWKHIRNSIVDKFLKGKL